MNEQVIQEIVSKTQSELILFFSLVLLGMVCIFIPVYRLQMKSRSEQSAREVSLRRDTLAVIEDNTKVMSEVKVLIEYVLGDNRDSLKRLHDRIDQILDKVAR